MFINLITNATLIPEERIIRGTPDAWSIPDQSSDIHLRPYTNFYTALHLSYGGKSSWIKTLPLDNCYRYSLPLSSRYCLSLHNVNCCFNNLSHILRYFQMVIKLMHPSRSSNPKQMVFLYYLIFNAVLLDYYRYDRWKGYWKTTWTLCCHFLCYMGNRYC